jgi:hypothetical protein
MSPAEDRIAEDAARRGAMLPPTPPDAVQRKTVSREASVTPGKSPARSPHPKAWDASFAKVPAPTLDEASASSSRDRAERVSREKHAHMEARAELLSLIAEAAADADVLGEAFPVIEGDVPGAASVRVALPPPRLAMREIKERRDRERAAEADRARRAEALEKLRKQQRETAAALRERRRADPAAAPTSAAEKKNGGGTRGAAGAAGASGEKENETERDLSSTDPLLSRADREEAARRAEVRAFIAESKARWRVKLAQEKTAARLREQARLEVLKQERAAAREAAREHAAKSEAAGEADETRVATEVGAPNSWDATPADVTETATGKKASSETGAPSPPPVRRVGASAAAAAAAEARETRNRTSAALGRFGVSTHAARAGIGASSSGPISGTKRDSQSANTSRDSSFPHSKEKGKARVARTSARASFELKKRWMEDEARARSAREAAVSGSSLGGSAFVDTAIGARVAEERRLRGEEAKERLRAEVEARLEAAKRAARAAAEDARAAAEKAAPTRAGAAALAAAASAAASAVARRGGQRDRVERARVTRVPTGSRAGAEPAPDAKSPAKSALKKTTPTKSPGAETSSSAAETSASARHISFAATVRESDGAEKPMSMPGGSEEPEEPSEASGTESGFGGNRGDTEGADDAPEDSPADDLLRSRPRLLERMRGPPSTRTVLPGDEHVPRAEDWLGMGQGGGAGRIARRLAKRRAPRDPDAPPLEPPDSREAAEAMKAKAFRSLPRDSSARRADIVDDIVAAAGDDDVAARLAARLVAERVSRTHREPRGVLSTYARRTFASLVAPAEAETRAGTEPDRAAQKPTLSLVSSTSAQTDPVAFLGDRGRSKETPPETSPAPENRAGRRKKPSAKKKAEEKRVAAASRANVDVASASDGTSDDLDFVPDASRNPLDRRAAFLAACLAEEEAAATAKRQSPDALESRFESELLLFEEMGDIAAELDAMRFARDAFDAEQAASKLAAVAESRRVELLGARQTLDAARSAADEYEALTKAAKAGDDSSEERTFTENDIARVAEAITEKMREESLKHLKEVTDAFLADVARGRKDAGDVAAASLRARLSEGSVFEGSAKEVAVATEPVALPLPVPELPSVPSELPSEAARESVDPEETSDSIVDEVGGVVPDASRLSESFVPEDSGLFSDDDAAREVDAKHEDVQRRLRDAQRELKSAELDAKRRRIAEMESRLVELEASAADAETELDFRATEAETAAMADEAESRDLDARLEAHGARVARLEALVEKRRLENLSLRKLTGKETTLREEMKRLDASVEKQTRAAAAARDAEDSGKKASVSPRVPRLDLSAASPASTTTRSPSPSPIAQAPDASTSPGSSDAEQVDSESLPEPPESDAASEVSTEPDVSRVSAASAPTRLSPTADAPPSSARAKPVSPKPAGLETISTTPPPPLVHTTPGFEALVRSASAHFVDAAARAALDASGAMSRGLDSAAAAALESESAFAAIKEIGVDDVRESLLREHGSAIDAKLATEACVAATKSLPARLVRDAVVETVRHAFPRVFESSFGKESTAADGFASALDPPGSSAAGAFAATSALAAAVGGGGLKGERLVDVVAARARAALTASDNAFPASDPRAAEAAEAAAEISAEISDAGGAETPLDAVVRADARESDDLGWYAVRAVEKAVATRLADELFDELVADTVLALVGVGETTSSGARRR